MSGYTHDTDLGGVGGAFPETQHSAIVALRSDEAGTRQRAWEALVAAYWKPVYKYLRLKYGLDNEHAKDLTQGFFAQAFEKAFFDRYTPGRAAFRTFLRTCLERYAANEHKAQQRLKRGGHLQVLALDFGAADEEFRLMPAAPDDMEAYFHREWVRSLFGLAVTALREECAASGRDAHWALFVAYDLAEESRPTYADLAGEHGLTETQVTNHLAAARQMFRRHLLAQLRAMTDSDAEYVEEARALLGQIP